MCRWTWSAIAGLVISIVGFGGEQQSPAPVFLNQSVDFGDWSNTQRLCNQILQERPDDPEALIARARLRVYVGRIDEAISDCDKVLATHPRFALALSTRGGILCDIGKTQAGQADLKLYLALTESAHDVATRFRRACAFDDLKNYESARQEFQGVVNDTASATLDADLFNRGMAQINLEKHKEAIESLTKLNHVHSVAPRLVSWLAYCHSEVGQPDIALKQFAEVADQQPDYFSNQGGWGLALEKLKKYDEAIRHYGRALQTNERYLFALRGRGRCYCIQQDYTSALHDFNNAIIIEPDDTYTITARACIFANLGQYMEATYDLNRVINLVPKDAYAWRQLAFSQGKLRNWKEAYAAANQVLRLTPTDTDALCNRAWIANEMGNHRQAHADFAAAIRINPKLASAYYSRGLLFRDEKQYSKSIALLSEAIRINPKNASYYCARGCAEVRNSNYRQAIADCTKSIQLSPRRTHPYLSRGEAYAALGKYDLALRDLTRVIDEYPWREALTKRAWVYQKLHKRKLAALDISRSRQSKMAD